LAALAREAPDADVTLVERDLVGGECSYWACIPSKTLLRPVELAAAVARTPGVSGARIDPEGVFAWRDAIAGGGDASQVKWVENLGAAFVRGDAEIAEAGLVRAGGRELPYDHLLVATGSDPATPPLDGLEDVRPWTSRDATSASEVPERLLVVGGGAVGCELAQLYARLGSEVVLVQSGATLLDRIDADAGALLAECLAEDGVEVRTGTRPSAVETAGGRVRLVCDGAGAGDLEGTEVLLAVGRRPRVEGYGLERVGVELERNAVKTDDRLAAADGVWAAGDVTGKALFTHVGKYQARIAAANVAGGERRADYRAIPAAIFTDPQIASVGDTSGKDGAVTATAELATVSRAGTYSDPTPRGFVKLFADPGRGVLVGAVVVGPEAGEMIGQLTVAVRADVPVDVLRDTIQPFPTFSEAVFFAARDLPL
ncbi:MAG TPA: NAD(P)/FAD-dependent oxidoreductase, partial [Gaiellaceae bacterium]|nr:NAD(P)/FAD-dependent oxidoreductase [Gaiellaceae bacterium]